MNNVSVVGEKYAVRFIHAAIKSLSKKKAVHMQALECRLWLSGLVSDFEYRDDFQAFADEYFAKMKREDISREEKDALREEYDYYLKAVQRYSL